jgi:hypothetical protein
MRGRWLTPWDKMREVANWDETKRDFATRADIPDHPLGGYGYPDPEIYAVCDRLNALPGVCTLQSCAGHERANDDGSKYVYAGQLWLWLDMKRAAAFERVAPTLAASPLVERLRKLWLRDGREVVDVEFTSGDQFTAATKLICRFFAELARGRAGGDR